MERKRADSTAASLIWIGTQTSYGAIIQIVSWIILSRLIPPGGFGTYGAALAIAASIGMLACLGLGPGLVKYRDSLKSVPETAVTLALITGSTGVVIVLFIAFLLGLSMQSSALILTLCILSVIALTTALKSTLIAHLQAQNMYRHIALFVAAGGTVQLAICIMLASWGWQENALALGAVTLDILVITCCLIKSPISFGVDIQAAKSLLGFSKSHTPAHFARIMMDTVEKLAVGAVAGATSLGIYYRSISIRTLGGSIIFTPIDMVFFPRISRAWNQGVGLKDEVQNACFMALTLTCILCVGIYFLAVDMVPILFGPDWIAAGPFIKYGVLALPFLAVARICEIVARSAGRQYANSGIDLFVIVALIIFVPIVHNTFGLNALPALVVSIFAARMLLFLAAVYRLSSITALAVIRYGALTSAVFVVAASLAVPLIDTFIAGPPSLIVSILTAGLTLALSGLLFGLLRRRLIPTTALDIFNAPAAAAPPSND